MSTIELSFEPLELRTVHPFGIAHGTASITHNVLVKLKYQGLEGLGEAAPTEYHGETFHTAMATLEQWSYENILGNDPFAIIETMSRLDQSVSGHPSVKAAIEMALHDLVGKIVQQPTYRLFGLSKDSIPITDFTIGLDSLEVVESKTIEAIEKGYKILKVKQGTTYDTEIIKRVRKVAPNIPIRVDANEAWTAKQAIRMSFFLAEHGVQFIEQPLPKYAHTDELRFVRENSALPIYGDESVCNSLDVARLHGAIDGVVVKLAKTGGLLEAIRVITVARSFGMQVMFGCMIESSIGITAACHLASLCDHLDLDGALLLANDPFCGAVYDDGYLRLPNLPGLGVTAFQPALNR